MKYLVMSVLAFSFACSDPTNDPNVDMTPPPPDLTIMALSCNAPGASQPTCKEVTDIGPNADRALIQSTLCSDPLMSTPCPRLNLLGGCRTATSNYTLTVWYYPGTTYKTSMQVQMACGAAYVPAQ